MSEIEKLLRNYEEGQEERLRLDARERERRKELESVTDSDITAAGVQRIISEARSDLDLIAIRRRKLKDPMHKAHRELESLWRTEGKAWNQRMESLQSAQKEQMCKALAPYFLGDEERLRKAVESILWTPAFDQLERAKYSFPFYTESAVEGWPDRSQQDLGRDVKAFHQHVARQKKALGLS